MTFKHRSGLCICKIIIMWQTTQLPLRKSKSCPSSSNSIKSIKFWHDKTSSTFATWNTRLTIKEHSNLNFAMCIWLSTILQISWHNNRLKQYMQFVLKLLLNVAYSILLFQLKLIERPQVEAKVAIEKDEC